MISLTKGLSFDQKWEHLKPVLEKLWLDGDDTLPIIRAKMLKEFDFDAPPRSYKYHFRKWKWRRNLRVQDKERLLSIVQERAQGGHSTVPKRRGRPVKTHTLLRHEKTKQRECLQKRSASVAISNESSDPMSSSSALSMSRWNLPFRTLVYQHSCNGIDVSLAFEPSSPSATSVFSLHSDEAFSPRLLQAVNLNNARRSAEMFVAGDLTSLWSNLALPQQRALSSWMSQFWYFGYISAKHWGHGPRRWSRDLLQADQNAERPAILRESLPGRISSNDEILLSEHLAEMNAQHAPEPPGSFCCWSIHVPMGSMGFEKQTISQPHPAKSATDPRSQWPDQWGAQPFEHILLDAIATNHFSTIDDADLPIDVLYLGKAFREHLDELWAEGLMFAIMGRNFDLIEAILSSRCIAEVSKRDRLRQALPLHVAVTYLDGSTACCKIVSELLRASHHLNLDVCARNKDGYTVFDMLMLTILRNHSQVAPEIVDSNLAGTTSFVGEEVSTCGMWDAESCAFRALQRNGSTQVPFSWKHKFCHTSTQAICHILELLLFSTSQLVKSGLFAHRCYGCSERLEVLPLHTMVLVAFNLMTHGKRDEDLFGMVCCLLCYTSSTFFGGQEFGRAEISLHLFYGHLHADYCAHELLSPAELAGRLSTGVTGSMPSQAVNGWQAFTQVLQLIEDQHRWAESGQASSAFQSDHKQLMQDIHSEESYFLQWGGWTLDEDDWTKFNFANIRADLRRRIFHHDRDLGFGERCSHIGYSHVGRAFGSNRLLGHIWAACQTELLTYRRQSDSLAWMSPGLTIDQILASLESEVPSTIHFIKRKALRSYCPCGRFDGGDRVPSREHACSYPFGNLNAWQRTTYLEDYDE